jgi:hypothetical protein
MGGRCFSHPIQSADCALKSDLSSGQDHHGNLGGLHARGIGRNTFGGDHCLIVRCWKCTCLGGRGQGRDADLVICHGTTLEGLKWAG